MFPSSAMVTSLLQRSVETYGSIKCTYCSTFIYIQTIHDIKYVRQVHTGYLLEGAGPHLDAGVPYACTWVGTDQAYPPRDIS